MKGLIIYGGIVVRWRIGPKLTAKYYLKSIPGLFILNPLEYVSTYNQQGFIDLESDFMFKGEGYMDTTGIIFGRTSQYRLKAEEVWDQVSEFFKYVRVHSLQYDLNYKHFHSFVEPIDRLTKSKVLPSEIPEFVMHEHSYSTLLKWTDFIKIDKIKSRGQKISVHREIFLDAVSAHFENDYRKSILYFCMACETKVSERLFGRYEELKIKKKLPNPASSSGQPTDPVYEILKKDKWHFKHKIHEHYIYLFGTSLLLDNKKLYDNLIRLYRTRNNIAHNGEIKVATKDFLTIDSTGSNKAFDFTIEFFTWLGDNSLEIFKGRKLIMLK